MTRRKAEAAPVVEPVAEVPEEVAGEVPGARVEACLNNTNQSSFGRMSEGGRNIASQAYEGLYKIPGVNRIVGKLEIAYNQFWADRNEKKAVGLKGEVDGLNVQTEVLDRSKKDVESRIAGLKQQGVPGTESLLLSLKDFDKEKVKLLNKKDKVQSAFESRDNKMKLYTNKRDMIADKLIGRYNEKLEPMEKELGNLETSKDRLDLSIAVTEAKHNNERLRLAGIEKTKEGIEESLRSVGTREKQIKKYVKGLEDELTRGNEAIRIEKESLAKRKNEINKNIAKVDAKANPNRDKREEFVRVKEGKLVKINVPTRTRGSELSDEEKISTHTRKERPAPVRAAETRAEAEEGEESPTEEEAEAVNEQITIEKHVSGWNTFIERKYKGVLPSKGVNQKDFLRTMKGMGLLGGSRLSSKDFKNILGQYYKFKKLPVSNLNADTNQFLGL